jgi:hypothetical protein
MRHEGRFLGARPCWTVWKHERGGAGPVPVGAGQASFQSGRGDGAHRPLGPMRGGLNSIRGGAGLAPVGAGQASHQLVWGRGGFILAGRGGAKTGRAELGC